MAGFIVEHIWQRAIAAPDDIAVVHGDRRLSYHALVIEVGRARTALERAGIQRGDRLAVYLESAPETVIVILAGFDLGVIVVPVNPALRSRQVRHILDDSGATTAVTSASRAIAVKEALLGADALRGLLLTSPLDEERAFAGLSVSAWADAPMCETTLESIDRNADEAAAILYTSGSTGLPKGVTLSHRNIEVGALSVASYLGHVPSDRILAVLPLSFDAGLSQITTTLATGARLVLHNYLLPHDLIAAVAEHGITGMTAVPPLWIPLSKRQWPIEAANSLRYVATTGGAMPRSCISRLRDALPGTQIFLMYGFTEAFRSTYLDPEQVAVRPESIGKAIPNVELHVVDEHGHQCPPHQPGELVHCGPLVALGYWNNPQATASKFRPFSVQGTEGPIEQRAAWSGDTVKSDDEGYLYFVARHDEMIKSSGFRISPTEVEAVIDESGLVDEVVVVGVPDALLGEAVVAVIVLSQAGTAVLEHLHDYCRGELPSYMMPRRFELWERLPRGPNNKLDRVSIGTSVINRASETRQ